MGVYCLQKKTRVKAEYRILLNVFLREETVETDIVLQFIVYVSTSTTCSKCII